MKELPVLTDTHWTMIGMVQMALEVYLGKRVKFFRLDMNTGHARIGAGCDQHDIYYHISGSSRVHFQLDEKWYCGVFDASDMVRVGCETSITDHVCHTVAGDLTLRWVGSSFTDRREEPLFIEDAVYCARVRGLTLEQLLGSKPVDAKFTGELNTVATTLTCPKCGGPVRHVGQTSFKQDGSKPILTDLLQCADSPQCEIKAYHADGMWPVEFIILNGQKHIVEPSASEFC